MIKLIRIKHEEHEDLWKILPSVVEPGHTAGAMAYAQMRQAGYTHEQSMDHVKNNI